MTNNNFSFKDTKKYVNLTKKLSNLPPNIGTPDYFVALANKEFDTEHFYVSDTFPTNLPLIGAVGGLNGVLLKIIHNPIDRAVEAFSTDPIVLIGKGVCFDSGGYNIKTEEIEEMKFDKCGGMSVYSVLKACQDQDFPLPVIGYIPLVNNLIGSEATLPGSVIKAIDGTRVEIRDTDAEGRLILADAINIAKTGDIGQLITVATLTGSCAYALGEHYTGLFYNEAFEVLADPLQQAAFISKDPIWRMPINEEHLKNLKKTKCADLLNYNKKECGGSSAAAFLSHFVGDQIPWAHLDIAGTAWKDGDTPTGRPTKLLLQYLENYWNMLGEYNYDE